MFEINFDEDIEDIEDNIDFMNTIDIASSRVRSMPFTGLIDGNTILFEAGKEHVLSIDLEKIYGINKSQDEYVFTVSADPFEIPFNVSVGNKQKPGKPIKLDLLGPSNNASYYIELINSDDGNVVYSENKLISSSSSSPFTISIPTQKNYDNGKYNLKITKEVFGRQEMTLPLTLKKSSPVIFIVGGALVGGILYFVISGGEKSTKNPLLPDPPNPTN